MSFTRQIAGYRRVATNYGDTLQKIAARELGDASRWHELVELNNLHPPFITDDPGAGSARVIVSGGEILIPSSAPVAAASSDRDAVFGTDAKLANRDLVIEDGDFAVVSGVDNLVQALQHVLITEPGEMLFHQQYGCGVRPFIGRGTQSRAIAGGIIKRALLADQRINRVLSLDVRVTGDAWIVDGYVETVDGLSVGAGAVYGISG